MIAKDTALNVDGLDITGRLYLPGETAGKSYPTLCICHGIPSGIPHEPGDGGYPQLAEWICRQDFAVFIFNFRGSGSSGGNLDMQGWNRDLAAAIDYLWDLSEIDRSRLSLMGFSAGAAISLYVASGDDRISSVVACSCPAEFGYGDSLPLIEHFRHIGAIRDEDFPPSGKDWINGFRSVSPFKYIAGIAPKPLLLVHGSRDETVKVRQAFELYQEAGEPKHMVVIDGAGHKLRQNERAMAIAIGWLKSQL